MDMHTGYSGTDSYPVVLKQLYGEFKQVELYLLDTQYSTVPDAEDVQLL